MLSRARNFQTWCDTYNNWLQTELTGTFTKRDLHHFPSYSNRPHRRWNAWIIIKLKYVTNKNKTPISKRHNYTQSNKLCKKLFSTIMSAHEDSLLFLNSIFFKCKNCHEDWSGFTVFKMWSRYKTWGSTPSILRLNGMK